MGKIGKTFALFLTAILAMSCLILLTAKAVDAQSLPTPSVPQFSLKFVDSSYDVPPTVTTNPYTGQNTTTPGYHVQLSTLLIIIQNQPLVYQKFEGANFYYNVNFKGHFEPNWFQWFIPEYLPTANASGPQTIIIMGTLSENSLSVGSGAQPRSIDVPANGTVDFQVEALIGSVGRDIQSYGWIFSGKTSGWSSTQTITVPTSSNSPTPTPTPSTSTPSPTVPELSWVAVILMLTSMLPIAVIIRRRVVSFG